MRTADIDDTGEYVLRVDSEDDEVMVRVGRDPSSGVVPMRVGAGALLVAGLVLGVIGLTRGRRPGEPEPAVAGDQWPPLAGPPFAADRAAVRQPAGAAAVHRPAAVARAGRAAAAPRRSAPAADPAPPTVA